MNFDKNFKETNIVPSAAEKRESNPIELAAQLISKVADIDILQSRQPKNFVGEVFTFKTKEQRKNELNEKVDEIEKTKESINRQLNDEELAEGAINFLAYALSKEDTRDDAKWEENTSPSERIRSFAENIVIENLPVLESYIENTTPRNTKQTFRILEKIIQLNQGKIFEAIMEGDLENPEELLKKFNYLRNQGEIPADFENEFLKLPGAKNYLTILKFLEKQAPVINEKIKEGLKTEPKLNEIIHEYVPGFESALKYLPIAKAKELADQTGELFKIQDHNHRGVLDIFIADYAAEINRKDGETASEFSHDRAGELKIGAKVFATAGYQYKEIGPAWNNSAPKEGIRDMMINNFGSLHELESKRPGSAKYLTDNFGIVCFSRYPTEVLIKQYDNRDKTNSPFGIYATGRSDHNGFMYDLNKKIKIEKLANETEPRGYMLKIIETANTIDATKKIINLTRKLEKKVSFMFVNAHGNTDSIAIGNWGGFRPELTTSNIGRPGIKRFFQYFEEGATLVLSSCLTGSDKGIAEEIAKTSGMTVIASDRKTSGINKLEVHDYKKDQLRFDVNFYTSGKGKQRAVFNEKNDKE
ncbi:MAG: hypothetical protein NTY31_00755 [Candidatus Falkowbacteria bacterium]|nr:hypothetical protein [Candidatus Falkowbacteria bacterium]